MKFIRTKRFWIRVRNVFSIVMLLIIVIMYFVLAPRFNPGLVRQILFHPYPLTEHAKEMMSLANVEAEEVSIPTKNATLNALYYKTPEAVDVVLMSHGNAGNIDHRVDKIKALIECGVSVLAYDYQAYGKSTGDPTVQGIVDDSVVAYDYLINEKKYKPDQIIFYGESIGTGVTTELARQRTCRAMILESGFSSPERRAKEKIPFLQIYPGFLMLFPTMDNLDYVKGKHPPLLLFAGKNDTMIPCSHSETMFREGTEPKQLVIGPNSEHNDFSKDFELYRKALGDFLKANGSKAPTASP